MESKFYECSCLASEHTIRFIFDKDDGSVYTEVYLNTYHNFFKRLWIAFKYAFKLQSKYDAFDCTLFNPDDVKDLRDTLTVFIRKTKKVKVDQELDNLMGPGGNKPQYKKNLLDKK